MKLFSQTKSSLESLTTQELHELIVAKPLSKRATMALLILNERFEATRKANLASLRQLVQSLQDQISVEQQQIVTLINGMSIEGTITQQVVDNVLGSIKGNNIAKLETKLDETQVILDPNTKYDVIDNLTVGFEEDQFREKARNEPRIVVQRDVRDKVSETERPSARKSSKRVSHQLPDREELDERVIDIKRVAKVIKGGRRFAFRTVVVVGDGKGRIGIGIGMARAVPDSIRKGTDRARRQMRTVSIAGPTIPHPVVAEYGGAKVLLRPAAPGTGVIAGGGVRAVLEAVGIRDVLTKSQGSNNLLNVAMATITALEMLRSPEQLAAMRGKPMEQNDPFWEQPNATTDPPH